jgi:hypothetical protein
MEEFLKNEDQKMITKQLKKLQEAKVGRMVNDLTLASGKGKVQMSNNSAMICSKFGDITDTYQFLNNELIECSKDIDLKCHELSNTFHSFKKHLESMATLNKSIKSNVQFEMY